MSATIKILHWRWFRFTCWWWSGERKGAKGTPGIGLIIERVTGR